jgi:hypothetical protein
MKTASCTSFKQSLNSKILPGKKTGNFAAQTQYEFQVRWQCPHWQPARTLTGLYGRSQGTVQNKSEVRGA